MGPDQQSKEIFMFMNHYVILDGMDGSGKGTQITLLQKAFGESAIFTREPGGTPYAEEIRKLVRDNPLAAHSTPLALFLLFWAARDELLYNLVLPTLREGKKHLFSDRGDSSTFAFQLCGEEQLGNLLDLFMTMRTAVFGKLWQLSPDLYIIFDLPAEVSRERVMRDTNREKTHFDERDLAYYKRVREGFRTFSKMVQRAQVEFVDATRPPEEVHQLVMEILDKHSIVP
jgi:dTMP kinase